jgi:RNA polymerase sigma-70 factor (ECF subfamily)
MAQLDHGDPEEALRTLQSRYETRIFNFVRGLLRDQHLAQDVTQEVFAKVYFKSHLYRQGTNFPAWLFEVARNQALSALRARRRSPIPVSNLAGNDESNPQDVLVAIPEDRLHRELEEEEFMQAFADAVASLPEHYQSVFDLCVRDGRSYQEAAEALDLPTGTVAIRIMRARKRLFRTLSSHLGRLRRPPACFQG